MLENSPKLKENIVIAFLVTIFSFCNKMKSIKKTIAPIENDESIGIVRLTNSIGLASQIVIGKAANSS